MNLENFHAHNASYIAIQVVVIVCLDSRAFSCSAPAIRERLGDSEKCREKVAHGLRYATTQIHHVKRAHC